jgi:hypothetical protein
METLTQQEAAELLRMQTSEVISLAASGEIPAVCLGDESGVGKAGRPAKWVFLREDLIAYFRARAKREQARRKAETTIHKPAPKRRRGAVELPELPS